MPVTHRPIVLLLAAVLVASPSTGEAKRHGHAHGGWMHARMAAMRGWFRHVAHVPVERVSAAPSRRKRGVVRSQRPVEQAQLAARRREEVDAYLRDHPALAVAN